MTREEIFFYCKSFLFAFVPYLIFFFSPIKWMLVAVGILVLADSYTGLRAARKRKERIHSRGLSRAVGKVSLYLLGIILSRMMELIFFPSIPLSSIVAGYIGVVEFKSNMENISEATGIDIWKALIDKISAKK